MLHLQYRRYRLPFRAPVRTAHGIWGEREGLLVRLQDVSEGGTGAVGYGEAAPLPEFGTETVDQDEAAVRALPEWLEDDAFEALPTPVRCLHHALRMAREQLASARDRANGVVEAIPSNYLGVAALLPAGKPALGQLQTRLESGFRVFKWKVGVGDVADELGLLDDLCAALPSGAKLRLDANGAWDRRRAERWMERCAERPIEFVEQPFAATVRGSRDWLLGLAGDYPTPVALDESLLGDDDLEAWLGAGWPGVYVLKPSLLADPAAACARLRKAKAAVVFSSALETAVGARSALRLAFAWNRQLQADAGETKPVVPRALGFGVWPLFADRRCDGPAAAPFLRWDDVKRLDAEAVWNALT